MKLLMNDLIVVHLFFVFFAADDEKKDAIFLVRDELSFIYFIYISMISLIFSYFFSKEINHIRQHQIPTNGFNI
jgi:phosphate starvation-inducible membrane PsiE